MKVSVDTNVLIRLVVKDDVVQTPAAERVFSEADRIAIGISCLCEFAWVLSRTYGYAATDIADAMTSLLRVKAVTVDRVAVEAGLDVLEAGGDFADGVIAFEGNVLGGEVHMTFDRQARKKLMKLQVAAREPTS